MTQGRYFPKRVKTRAYNTREVLVPKRVKTRAYDTRAILS